MIAKWTNSFKLINDVILLASCIVNAYVYLKYL